MKSIMVSANGGEGEACLGLDLALCQFRMAHANCYLPMVLTTLEIIRKSTKRFGLWLIYVVSIQA